MSAYKRGVAKGKAETTMNKDNSDNSDHQAPMIMDEIPKLSKDLVPGGPFAKSMIFVRALYELSTLCTIPWFYTLDYFLAMFTSTTEQEFELRGGNCKSDEIIRFVKAFAVFNGLMLLSPLALFGFVIWFPLQVVRPRAYSYICPTNTPLDQYHAIMPEFDTGAGTSPTSSLIGRKMSASSILAIPSFTVVTSNLCLMPEFIARINNLSNSIGRSKKMASYFADGAVTWRAMPHEELSGGSSWRSLAKTGEHELLTAEHSSNDDSLAAIDLGIGHHDSAFNKPDEMSMASTLWSVTSKERVVSETFNTPADFLCLQEVFDRRPAKRLLEGLRARFPYIIHDVAWPLHDCCMTVFNSGLCVASRYPFVDARFHAFPHGHRDDKLACKGLLMTKVYLGRGKNGEDLVGFIANTHLQAWSNEPASQTRVKQLQSINEWMNDFFVTAGKRSNSCDESVLFNVISGDFNFDRMSHYNEGEQGCDVLKHFRDPCMDESSGKLHSWVVGTELIQPRIYDESVRTPQRLQRMLVSELERCQFVSSTKPAKVCSAQMERDGQRKIDYILYRDAPDYSTVIQDFRFYTGLATLTDHLPIGMTFTCEKSSSSQSAL